MQAVQAGERSGAGAVMGRDYFVAFVLFSCVWGGLVWLVFGR